ncbi:MAG: hypothetical protein V4676_12690 [Bacteroidota bacterium]
MKIFYLFVLFLLMTAAAVAQNSWKICLDKKVLLATSVENEEKNLVKVKTAVLKKYKSLIVQYKQADEVKDWERTITIYNEEDAVLKSLKGSQFKITIGTLQQLFKKSKTLEIYTWALPKDPKLAATVRVRRVHLGTLVLE